MGELFRDRRWRFLLDVILRLPRTSRTREVMVSSEEMAALILNDQRDDEPESRGPRVSEFSAEVEALYAVVDRLGEVCSGLVGLGGNKPRRVTPMPRPQTALDKVRQDRRRAEHEALTARLLPNRDHESG